MVGCINQVTEDGIQLGLSTLGVTNCRKLSATSKILKAQVVRKRHLPLINVEYRVLSLVPGF